MQTNLRPQVEVAREPSHSRSVYLTIGGLTALLLIAASWGHISVFWGDYGKWLYEVQEVGRGKQLYTQVYWPQLPLAAWVFGTWTRIVGAELHHIWMLTSAIALALSLLFAEYFATLVPDRRSRWLLPLSLVIVFATAGMNSAPLGLGMYMPATPLGATFLLLSLLLALRVISSPHWSLALALGFAAGVVLTTKIDFWPPLGALVLMVLVYAPRSRWMVFCAMVVGGLTVAVPVFAKLLTQFQLREWWELLMGFGQAREFGGRASPTLERVVLEIASTASILGLLLAAVPSKNRSERHWRWFTLATFVAAISAVVWVANGPEGPIDVGMFGWPGKRVALEELAQAIADHVPSALLPVAALIILVRWRPAAAHADERRALILVATVACAARARRMGEHIDVTNALIELPLYIGMARSLFPSAMQCGDAYRRGAAVLFLVAGFSHWHLGHGLFTRRGWRPATETPRGFVHIPPNHGQILKRLVAKVDSIDPSNTRPVFAFGYSGGINYFLNRKNPTAMTQGFAFAVHATPSENVALLAHADPRVILLDKPSLAGRTFARGGFNLLRWRAPQVLSPYTRVDRPLFDSLTRDCVNKVSLLGFPDFVLYDCRG